MTTPAGSYRSASQYLPRSICVRVTGRYILGMATLQLIVVVVLVAVLYLYVRHLNQG
jgi:hypothetical protein